jgi:hypothetical protein
MHCKATAIVGAVALLMMSVPAIAAGEPKHKITLEDPAGDVTGREEGPAPLDIVNVELSSDGEFVVIGVTLAAAPKPVSIFDALVAGVAFDVDNDAKSGGQAFGGMYGDVAGFEFESEIVSSVEDGAVSKSSAASVIAIDVRGNQSNVLTSSDAPSTPAKDKTYTGRIAYASLGVKPGATLRVIVRELDDRGERAGMFPDVQLTLK